MAGRRASAEGPGIAGRIVALDGPSGVGKSSVARALASATGGTVVAEALDRLRPAPSLEVPDSDGLARLEIELLDEERARGREARAIAGAGELALLDTSFFGPVTYSHGLAVGAPGLAPGARRVYAAARRLARAGAFPPIDALLYLSAPAPVVAARVAADPSRRSTELAERHARVARCERWLWLERYRALAPERLFLVPARSSLSSVVERIRDEILPRVAALGSRPPSAGRIVEAFARPGAVPRRRRRGVRAESASVKNGA